jgi:hypothetical protein
VLQKFRRAKADLLGAPVRVQCIFNYK